MLYSRVPDLTVDAFRMSSIGSGYDQAVSTFSPDGRIFQVKCSWYTFFIGQGIDFAVSISSDFECSSKLRYAAESDTSVSLPFRTSIEFHSSSLALDVLLVSNYSNILFRSNTQ